MNTSNADIAAQMPTQYLQDFFAEKEIAPVMWELKDNNGMSHDIGNDVVIEFMALNLKAEDDSTRKIEATLRKVDFLGGDVNDFLKHLAGWIINN
jgi:hypothetical protein